MLLLGRATVLSYRKQVPAPKARAGIGRRVGAGAGRCPQRSPPHNRVMEGKGNVLCEGLGEPSFRSWLPAGWPQLSCPLLSRTMITAEGVQASSFRLASGT